MRETDINSSRKSLPAPRPYLIEPAKNPKPASSHRLAWSLCIILFAVSLTAAVATIVQTFASVRIRGNAPPAWLHTLTLVCEAGLALSGVGIVILVTLSILRATREK